ncbi:transcriptional regulator with XRE-family HTH domain [Kitasatospora sp. GP30]|uniref:helix-turn-helix domain-containing protein n=1 Tax=Kitasatospora sp. GP30 TaxID=3035084 RepID=UPI000C703AC6|nr:helix-turn-helix transcriptional regulator [Kitasatospora sp. GP30]MDH6138929.1 transcriptional regulator with XRE-family HTH domain [Kitasatospora sp. GP30]
MNIKKLNPAASPRAAFGAQLRRSREERGWTQDQLGEYLECTGGHVSGVETAVKSPSKAFSIKCDRLFGTGMVFQILWRAIKGNPFMDGFPAYTAEEASAEALRVYEDRRIPGLLQTASYAAALESGNVLRGKITQEQADARVSFLMERQQLLTKIPLVTLHVIMDESCLQRTIGGPKVMIDQFRKIEEMFKRPKTTIQVAPNSIGATHPLAHPVTLLTMPGRGTLGYTETLQRGFVEKDLDTLHQWGGDYDQLQVEAHPQAASLGLIQQVREDLEHG